MNKLTRIEKDEKVVVNVALRLACRLEVFGKLVLRAALDCDYWSDRRVVLWENASAWLWGNASAVLRGNASAVLWGNASAVLREMLRLCCGETRSLGHLARDVKPSFTDFPSASPA